MIKYILEGLKSVAEGIDSVQKISEAVRTGINYIAANHPEIKNDLKLLLEELNKSLRLIKRSSAVLTNFRFAVSTDIEGKELSRFNDYYIKSKEEAYHLETHIEDLRTHCSKVREQSSNISGGYGVDSFKKIFGFLGLRSGEREQELAQTLDQLAYEDFAVANSAEIMLNCLTKSLQDVQDALGKNGTMKSSNIQKAASLLAEYGAKFEVTEEQAHEAIKIIQETVKQLS
jgi:hypothetical protein